jgi:hypothetical protein
MVTCPECGKQFSRRGLAGHRRLAHEVRVETRAPAAPTPAASDAELLGAALVGALAPLLERLEGLAERVESALLVAGPRPADAGAGSRVLAEAEDLDGTRLRLELEGVLGAIEREKRELRAIKEEWGGDEPPDEQERLRRERAWRRLGRLRRRQASLIFRIEDLVPGSQPGALESGVGTL